MEHILHALFASELIDDLYQASCAHEHKAHGLEWVRSLCSMGSQRTWPNIKARYMPPNKCGSAFC